MRHIRTTLLAVGLTLLAGCMQQPEPPSITDHAAGYDRLAAAQIAADSQPGPRYVPGHVIPVPTAEVSPELRALVAAPYPQGFNADPKTPAEWKEWVNARAQANIARLPAMKENLGVRVESTTIAGVVAGLVPVIQLLPRKGRNSWMRGPSPRTTTSTRLTDNEAGRS